MNRAVFKYIEHELYNFDATKRDLEQLREDIISQGPALGEAVGGSGPSDPTARKGIRLVTSPAIVKMTRTVDGITRALERLGPDHRALYELKYRQLMDWQAVCQEMPTSERTYFRLRKEIVTMVALELGHLAETWQE